MRTPQCTFFLRRSHLQPIELCQNQCLQLALAGKKLFKRKKARYLGMSENGAGMRWYQKPVQNCVVDILSQNDHRFKTCQSGETIETPHHPETDAHILLRSKDTNSIDFLRPLPSSSIHSCITFEQLDMDFSDMMIMMTIASDIFNRSHSTITPA